MLSKIIRNIVSLNHIEIQSQQKVNELIRQYKIKPDKVYNWSEKKFNRLRLLKK